MLERYAREYKRGLCSYAPGTVVAGLAAPVATVAPVTPAAADSEQMVYVTPTRKKYHSISCRTVTLPQPAKYLLVRHQPLGTSPAKCAISAG